MPDDLGGSATLAGLAAAGTLFLRESAAYIHRRWRNGKGDDLREAMRALAKNQEKANDILAGIRTDLKVVLDRIPR